jgi:uncharacterized cupin superfamily protein
MAQTQRRDRKVLWNINVCLWDCMVSKWHRHREGTGRSSETSISAYETVWCQNGTDTEKRQEGPLKHQYLSAYETVWCQNGTDTEKRQEGALKHKCLPMRLYGVKMAQTQRRGRKCSETSVSICLWDCMVSKWHRHTEKWQEGPLKHQCQSTDKTVWCQNLFRKLLTVTSSAEIMVRGRKGVSAFNRSVWDWSRLLSHRIWRIWNSIAWYQKRETCGPYDVQYAI